MPRAPRLKGREVVAALRRVGFVVVRVKGSHVFVRHADGRSTVVPIHAGETIGIGLFLKILKDAELSVEDFSAFL